MGQAAVDLPDPLDAPPPSSLSGTDDLLAQLAGDEIDRLLAEADVEQTSSPAPAPVTPIDTAPAATTAAVEAMPSVAPAGPSAAASLPGDDDLNALLNQLEESGPGGPASV